jgi:hypothetical protein
VTSRSPLTPPTADAKSIQALLRLLQQGRVGIPSFQRDYKWDKQDILNLFDSIYRGYPIGSLLLWETERTDGSATRFGPLSFDPAPGARLLVVDGQQRLTTLAVALLRSEEVLPGVDARWSVFFDLATEGFELASAQKAPQPEWLPVNVILDTPRYLEWVRRIHDDRLIATADRVASAIKDYRIPVYIVETDDEMEVRQIFRRMNDYGKTLKEEDIFRALTGRRTDDIAALREKILSFGFGGLEPQTLLKVVAAVAGVDPRQNLKAQIDARHGREWVRALEAARVALGLAFEFLMEEGAIPHAELLPYPPIAAPLAKLFDLHPSLRQSASGPLQIWLWRGIQNGDFEHLSTSTLAGMLDQIGDDLEASVRALQGRLNPQKNAHDVAARHDFRSSTTKVLGCLMASLAPMDLQTGERIDVRRLLDRRGAAAFVEIVPRRRFDRESKAEWDLRAATANRLLHADPERRVILDEIIRAPVEVAASHAIDDRARSSLAASDYLEFLRRRAQGLKLALDRFFEARIAAVEETHLGVDRSARSSGSSSAPS